MQVDHSSNSVTEAFGITNCEAGSIASKIHRALLSPEHSKKSEAIVEALKEVKTEKEKIMLLIMFHSMMEKMADSVIAHLRTVSLNTGEECGCQSCTEERIKKAEEDTRKANTAEINE